MLLFTWYLITQRGFLQNRYTNNQVMRLLNIIHQLVFIKRLLSDPNDHWSLYLTEFYCGESLSGFNPVTTLSFKHSADV